MTTYQATGCSWPETALACFIDRHSYGSLATLQQAALAHPETFWSRVVEAVGLQWSTPYVRVLDLSEGPMRPPGEASTGASGWVVARR